MTTELPSWCSSQIVRCQESACPPEAKDLEDGAAFLQLPLTRGWGQGGLAGQMGQNEVILLQRSTELPQDDSVWGREVCCSLRGGKDLVGIGELFRLVIHLFIVASPEAFVRYTPETSLCDKDKSFAEKSPEKTGRIILSTQIRPIKPRPHSDW